MSSAFGYTRMPSDAERLSLTAKLALIGKMNAAGRKSTLMELEGVDKRLKPQKRYMNSKRESAIVLPSATSLEMTKQSFIQKQIAKDRAFRKRYDSKERGSMPLLNKTVN